MNKHDLPRDHQVRDAISLLRNGSYRKIEADLLAALDRERRCGTTTADGFPGSTDGGGSSGIARPVEATVLARERAVRDRQHDCTVAASRDLLAAAALLAGVEQRLQVIADDRADAPITPRFCGLCTRAGLKDPRPWERKGNVGGKLATDEYLCKPHLDYVSRYGEAPSDEQTRHWDRTGSWRVPVPGASRWQAEDRE